MKLRNKDGYIEISDKIDEDREARISILSDSDYATYFLQEKDLLKLIKHLQTLKNE